MAKRITPPVKPLINRSSKEITAKIPMSRGDSMIDPKQHTYRQSTARHKMLFEERLGGEERRLMHLVSDRLKMKAKILERYREYQLYVSG